MKKKKFGGVKNRGPPPAEKTLSRVGAHGSNARKNEGELAGTCDDRRRRRGRVEEKMKGKNVTYEPIN